MSRWEPDAKGRLQSAAMALFLERGYAEVTVTDIAERAGLTKRSFFNHFVDKREVLFADAEAFRRTLTEYLAALDPGRIPSTLRSRRSPTRGCHWPATARSPAHAAS